jgi:hypothetical protein
MVPSSKEDMLVSAGGDRFRVRLTDAKDIRMLTLWDGFKARIRTVLDDFPNTGQRSPAHIWTRAWS